MKFCKAVDSVGQLNGKCEAGLKAMGKHSSKVRANSPTGSIDIDKALLNNYSQDNRYDYGIGLPNNRKIHKNLEDKIVWIEVHSAITSEVSVVLKKQRALELWLRENSDILYKMSERYIWIPSKNVDIPKHVSQYKILQNSRVELVSSPCHLD